MFKHFTSEKESPRKAVAQGSAARAEAPATALGPAGRTPREGRRPGSSASPLCLTRLPAGPQGVGDAGTEPLSTRTRSGAHFTVSSGNRCSSPSFSSLFCTDQGHRPKGRGSRDPQWGGAAPTPVPSQLLLTPLRPPHPPSWFQLAHRSGVAGVRTQRERLRAARRRWSCRSLNATPTSLSHLKAVHHSGKGTSVRDLEILCFKTNLGSSLRARVMLQMA